MIIDAKDLVFEYYNYDDNGEVKETVRALNGTSIQVEEG